MVTKIILFRGFPAVGKTFLSNKITSTLKITIVRKDGIYDKVFNYVDTHQKRNEICYKIIYQLIDTNLKAGIDLIVDCPFRNFNDLNKLEALITERNGELKSILCNCSDEELWAERLRKRPINPNNLITDFDELKKHYGNLNLARYKLELVLDTKGDLEMLVEKIIEHVI